MEADPNPPARNQTWSDCPWAQCTPVVSTTGLTLAGVSTAHCHHMAAHSRHRSRRRPLGVADGSRPSVTRHHEVWKPTSDLAILCSMETKAKGRQRRSLWAQSSHRRNEATMLVTNAGIASNARVCVTVQVIKTGLTPQLAPADHVREAEKEQLHPAEQLHTRW